MAKSKKEVKAVEKDYTLISYWAIMIGIFLVVISTMCFGADLIQKIADIAKAAHSDDVIFYSICITLVFYFGVIMVHYIQLLIKKIGN